MKPFAIQHTYRCSKEAFAILQYAVMENIPYKIIKDDTFIPEDYIPVGSVEFCLLNLNRNISPNYYPNFMQKHLHRNVYKANDWPVGNSVFIKPADKYKRFAGFVTDGTYRNKKRGPYWCSDIVKFTNEWRYYVANGKILTGEWYSGDEINTPDAPPLDIEIPSEYCGAIDFGVLDTGELALVEAHHPFGCGWYGKDCKLYAKWLSIGWEHILQEKEN